MYILLLYLKETWTMWIILQKDATMYILLYFFKLLYIFRVVTPPIIRSIYNCNYNSTIAEGNRNVSIILSWICTLHFPKFDQCQML